MNICVFLYNLPSLSERRETICKRFFEKSVLSSTSCLHYVLPPCRDTNIIAKLRSASVYATPTVRTNRFNVLIQLLAATINKWCFNSSPRSNDRAVLLILLTACLYGRPTFFITF